jgi:GGDEF domain-containing protein
VEYISPKGEKILELEEVVTLANGKRAMVPVGELGIDAVTSLIKSSDGRGREVLGKLIAANSNQGAILFLDVNNLGKVNYFAGKSAAGDQYLAAVAKALKESIRPEDVAFRHGGDELVAFIHTTNPERIKQIAANIQNKIDRDPGLRQLFIEEVKQYTDAARAVRSSKSFNDLPDSVRVRLSEDQIRLAHRDYRGFQNTVFDEFIAAAQDQSRYRPSASIGTTLLGNDTLETAILRADTQSAQVKALYKEASGLDASKYMTSRTQNTSARPDPRARPPIFDPVPAP